MMRRSRSTWAVAFALALSAAAPASAQFARPEDAVKYRQGALYVLSTHFARIGAMVNGRAPYDARAALENAELVAALARLPAAGFGAGTDHISQKAKPEIWTEQVRFKEQSDRMVSESAKLLAAARANNIDQIKAAYSATAATCKSCHDGYRNN
jgi:cytochrome c556